PSPCDSFAFAMRLIIIRNRLAIDKFTGNNTGPQDGERACVAKSTKKQLRATWLQVHKWIGLLLAVLIIPISVTGSALVWHDWLDEVVEPQRHQVLGEAVLPPSAYAAAATELLAPD